MSGLIAGSIQMEASEVEVTVKQAEHPNLPDDTWFLTLSVAGGYCTIGGTFDELRALVNVMGLINLGGAEA